MGWFGELWRRLWMRLHRRQLNADLEDEMRLHIELRAQEQIEAGTNSNDARYIAQRRFGNTQFLKEASREMWGWIVFERVAQDLHYALRTMRRSPGFTAVAVLSLALGIGANTAIFSVVNTVLVRPLPYSDPDRLVTVSAVLANPSASSGIPTRVHDPGVPYAALLDSRSPFAAIATDGFTPYVLTGGDEPIELLGCSVSVSLFRVLGVSAWRGRTFMPEEESIGHDGVAVVSYDLWERRFGSDPHFLGKSLLLNDRPHTVIGIMPRGFHYPPYEPSTTMKTEIWTPLPMAPQQKTDSNFRASVILARIRPGVSLEQAASQATMLIRQIESVTPGAPKCTRARVIPLKEGSALVNVRPALLALLAAVSFVLLVGCANVANLQLARAAARSKELAVRAAIGAGRRRLMEQLLTESLLVSMLGGLVGLAFAALVTHALALLIPATIPRREEIGTDHVVLIFAFMVSLLTGVVTGLVPARNACRIDPITVLKESNSQVGWSGERLRGLFVVSQIAFSLVLLVGAGLLMNSFVRLLRVKPGFDLDHVMAVSLDLGRGFGLVSPNGRYGSATRVVAFYHDLIDRAKATPGVQAAGTISGLPVAAEGYTQTFPFAFEGQAQEATEHQMASYATVSADTFRALGIPVLRGRNFTDHDRQGTTPSVIVSQSLAQRYWGNGDPTGKRMNCGPLGWRTIVGIVGDVRLRLDREAPPWFYAVYTQLPDTYTKRFGRYLTLVARVHGAPRTIEPVLRDQVRSLDLDLPVGEVKSMEEVISEAMAPRRFYLTALGFFALSAMAMAMAGIYGVVAYWVTQRTHEIGVRIALGATGSNVLQLILMRSILLTFTGVAIGVFVASLFTRLLAAQLYGITSTDTVTFTGVSVLLALVAIAASYVPAHRASRLDPIVALRYE